MGRHNLEAFSTCCPTRRKWEICWKITTAPQSEKVWTTMTLLLLVQAREVMMKCNKMPSEARHPKCKWTFYLLDSFKPALPSHLVIWYFVIYPLLLHKQTKTDTKENFKQKGQTKHSSFRYTQSFLELFTLEEVFQKLQVLVICHLFACGWMVGVGGGGGAACGYCVTIDAICRTLTYIVTTWQ